jgi:hypothetical protein
MPCQYAKSCLQILYKHGLIRELLDLDGTFSWPQDVEKRTKLCEMLNETGCCAFSFQRIATAFLVSLCHMEEALVVASLSSQCSAVGPLSHAALEAFHGQAHSWLVPCKVCTLSWHLKLLHGTLYCPDILELELATTTQELMVAPPGLQPTPPHEYIRIRAPACSRYPCLAQHALHLQAWSLSSRHATH